MFGLELNILGIKCNTQTVKNIFCSQRKNIESDVANNSCNFPLLSLQHNDPLSKLPLASVFSFHRPLINLFHYPRTSSGTRSNFLLLAFRVHVGGFAVQYVVGLVLLLVLLLLLLVRADDVVGQYQLQKVQQDEVGRQIPVNTYVAMKFVSYDQRHL